MPTFRRSQSETPSNHLRHKRDHVLRIQQHHLKVTPLLCIRIWSRLFSVKHFLQCELNLTYGHSDVRKHLVWTGLKQAYLKIIEWFKHFIFIFDYIRNYEKYFVQGLKLRRLIYEDYVKVWQQGVDFLLTPVTLTDAPLFSEYKQHDSRTQSAQQVHQNMNNNCNFISV